jgi:hypothetical protein
MCTVGSDDVSGGPKYPWSLFSYSMFVFFLWQIHKNANIYFILNVSDAADTWTESYARTWGNARYGTTKYGRYGARLRARCSTGKNKYLISLFLICKLSFMIYVSYINVYIIWCLPA